MSEISQFIYRLKPTRQEMLVNGPTPEEKQAVSEHFNYLKDLCEKGVLVLAGRTLNNDEQTFGIAVLNAETESAARGIMINDPAVKRGVMSAELFPFRVALISQQKLE